MASCFENVSLLRYNDLLKSFEILIENINLKIEILQKELILFISNINGETIDFRLNLINLNHCKLSKHQILINSENIKIGIFELSNFVLEFQNENDLLILLKRIDNSNLNIRQIRENKKENQFDSRTEKWSATQYFQFYSYLSQQQNMMQDYIRTSTYQRAVLNNCIDFRNKIVLDVGAGSGILSFFAAQAGAKKVYAVEASNMSVFCDQLIQNNKLAGKIIVIPGKIEEIIIPEPVDILISEPMGYMLLNERMLETYVHARKFLRPDIPVMMFPTVADLYVAPFSDEALYMEVSGKANFWYQQSFHGVDLSAVRDSANKENFSQPIVDVFDINICMSSPLAHKIDFRTVLEEELYEIDVPLKFTFYQTGCCHGLAIWFDVGFLGSQKDVWLSTSPTEPLTHWYQVRCLFLTPLFVYEGQTVIGHMHMNANSRQSYDVDIELSLPGTSCKVTNSLDLKNPYFRYTGQPVQSPPGNHGKPPTENYFSIYNGNTASHNNPTDFNMQSTPTLNGGVGTPMKTQGSWSGDSFNNQSPQASYGFLQNNLVNGTTMSPFSPNNKGDDYEAGKWTNGNKI